MLHVEGIWKHFRPLTGHVPEGVGLPNRGVSFDVSKGEIFGLIGPDGAGKTTLMRVLTTLLLPSGGSARLNGLDLVRDYRMIRKQIGYMPGVFSLYHDLTVEENLRFFATLFRTTVRANYHLIEPIYRQILPFRKRKSGALSGGMKQKLALCCALIHSPMVLFLDEPTTGVDPVSRAELWDLLRGLAGKGVTILVSTGYMDEANLCDRVALMRLGQIITINSPRGLVESYPDALYRVEGPNMHMLLSALRLLPSVHRAVAFGDSHHVSLLPGFSLQDFLASLETLGFTSVHVQPICPTVEDAFMALDVADA